MATNIPIPILDQDDVNALLSDQLVQIKRRDKALIQMQQSLQEKDEYIVDLEERLASGSSQTVASGEAQEPVTPGDLTPEKEENTPAAPTPASRRRDEKPK